jgi:hypothetical protein
MASRCRWKSIRPESLFLTTEQGRASRTGFSLFGFDLGVTGAKTHTGLKPVLLKNYFDLEAITEGAGAIFGASAV